MSTLIYKLSLANPGSMQDPVLFSTFRGAEAIEGLLADEAHVYSLDVEFVTANSIHLNRCATGGCGMNPTQLGNLGGIGDATGFDADDVAVYWGARGKIFKVAK
jgi:hypothetical protein